MPGVHSAARALIRAATFTGGCWPGLGGHAAWGPDHHGRAAEARRGRLSRSSQARRKTQATFGMPAWVTEWCSEGGFVPGAAAVGGLQEHLPVERKPAAAA